MDIIEFISQIKQCIEENDFNEYWPGFRKIPFALYDKNKVYLCNYNGYIEEFKKHGDIYIGKWNEKFIGNTSIKFTDTYIAIWNLEDVDNKETAKNFYPGIVHEMFHGNQSMRTVKEVIANEGLMVKYPFSSETIFLRNYERECLLKAVLEKDLGKKQKLVLEFINVREKRSKLIGECIEYEFRMESHEGSAYYVEHKARKGVSILSEKDLILEEGDKFIKNKDLTKFRMSCYTQGLFIGLILDETYPNWKNEYEKSELHLYDFLKYCINVDVKDIDLDMNLCKAENILKTFNNLREAEFDDFKDSKGYKIEINGKLKLTGFDPVNIVSLKNRILHKHFISFNNNYFIKGKIVSSYSSEIWDIDKIEFFTNEEPKIINDKLYIKDIGEFKGDIKIKGTTYIVNIVKGA